MTLNYDGRPLYYLSVKTVGNKRYLRIATDVKNGWSMIAQSTDAAKLRKMHYEKRARRSSYMASTSELMAIEMHGG